jgi:hypothetical protein
MRVSNRKFRYDAATKRFTAEISEFGKEPPALTQLYPDAADVGIVIMSAETGKEVRFYLKEEEKEPVDGDLIAWHFEIVPEDARKMPQCAGMTITIWND